MSYFQLDTYTRIIMFTVTSNGHHLDNTYIIIGIFLLWFKNQDIDPCLNILVNSSEC